MHNNMLQAAFQQLCEQHWGRGLGSSALRWWHHMQHAACAAAAISKPACCVRKLPAVCTGLSAATGPTCPGPFLGTGTRPCMQSLTRCHSLPCMSRLCAAAMRGSSPAPRMPNGGGLAGHSPGPGSTTPFEGEAAPQGGKGSQAAAQSAVSSAAAQPARLAGGHAAGRAGSSVGSTAAVQPQHPCLLACTCLGGLGERTAPADMTVRARNCRRTYQ